MNTRNTTHAPLISSQSPLKQRTAIRPLLPLLAVSVLLLQAACVSNVSSQIKESNKDTSGAYDGQWIAKVQRSAGTQYMPGNWIANCNGKPTEFPISVKKGVASVWHQKAWEKTFVNADGDFRFHIPLTYKARSSAGSGRDMALKGTNRIIYGNLKNRKGRNTFGYEDFGNSGCTAVIKFERKKQENVNDNII